MTLSFNSLAEMKYLDQIYDRQVVVYQILETKISHYRISFWS